MKFADNIQQQKKIPSKVSTSPEIEKIKRFHLKWEWLQVLNSPFIIIMGCSTFAESEKIFLIII